MYNVTAIYQGEEISTGEGEGYAWAMNEAAEGVPSIYPAEDVVLRASKEGHCMTVDTPLQLWREMGE